MNRRHCLLAFCVFSLLCLSPEFAQNYRCDWSVVGIGGGDMAGSAYKCGATAGQTAAGFMTASNYWALIGYWLPEGQVGIKEAAQWSSGLVRETKLLPTPQSLLRQSCPPLLARDG